MKENVLWASYEENMDGRRRQWLPLSSEFPFDKTGTRLQEELGIAGPLVWVYLLTAAKRSDIQGWFTYTTDDEAWRNLGVANPAAVGFTLDDFFTLTGRLKKTARRRRGRITDVRITAWEEWNNTPRTGSGRTEKSKSAPLFVRHPTEKPAPEADEERAYDSDSDNDSDRKAAEFQQFNLERARWVVEQRQSRGEEVLNPGGLAFHISENDVDHITESARVWLHRDCVTCGGSGFVRGYSPGGGGYKTVCDAV